MTPPISLDAWVSNDPRVARARERQRSMAAHPSNYRRDEQPGIAELLAEAEVPPLSPLEEEIYTVMGELASILVEIATKR